MVEEIVMRRDSWSVGTNAKGGSIKVYLDLENLKESEQKIARGLLLFRKFKEDISNELLADIVKGDK